MNDVNVVELAHQKTLERIEDRLFKAGALKATRKMNGGKTPHGLFRQVAEAADVSRAVVDTWYNRGTRVSELALAAIAEKTNTRHTWLTTGEGVCDRRDNEDLRTARATIAISQVTQIALLSPAALVKLQKQIIEGSQEDSDAEYEQRAQQIITAYHQHTAL